MTGIKNIIFDFGGIFIDVDYKKTEQAFINAGITNFHHLYSQHNASPLFEQFEKGEIDETKFFQQLRTISGSQLSDQQIIQCWNSMLGDYYPDAIEKARALKGKYRLFLFSNTNIIHYNFVMKKYEEQFGKRNFTDLFEKAYFSHTAGLRKPYPEAFEWVLKDAGITAAETLFIDDTISNIEGAQKAGMPTIFLPPPQKLSQLSL